VPLGWPARGEARVAELYNSATLLSRPLVPGAAPPEGCLGLREGNRIVKEQATRPHVTRVGYAFAGRFRAAPEQGAACPPAGTRLLISDFRFLISEAPGTRLRPPTARRRRLFVASNQQSAISNLLLAGLLASRRDGFTGLVQGLSSPSSERRPYHGRTPYLRPGRSPVHKPVAQEIGRIRPMRRIRPISSLLPPKPNPPTPNTLLLFFPPTIWPESLRTRAFAWEGHWLAVL